MPPKWDETTPVLDEAQPPPSWDETEPVEPTAPPASATPPAFEDTEPVDVPAPTAPVGRGVQPQTIGGIPLPDSMMPMTSASAGAASRAAPIQPTPQERQASFKETAAKTADLRRRIEIAEQAGNKGGAQQLIQQLEQVAPGTVARQEKQNAQLRTLTKMGIGGAVAGPTALLASTVAAPINEAAMSREIDTDLPPSDSLAQYWKYGAQMFRGEAQIGSKQPQTIDDWMKIQEQDAKLTAAEQKLVPGEGFFRKGVQALASSAPGMIDTLVQSGGFAPSSYKQWADQGTGAILREALRGRDVRSMSKEELDSYYYMAKGAGQLYAGVEFAQSPLALTKALGFDVGGQFVGRVLKKAAENPAFKSKLVRMGMMMAKGAGRVAAEAGEEGPQQIITELATDSIKTMADNPDTGAAEAVGKNVAENWKQYGAKGLEAAKQAIIPAAGMILGGKVVETPFRLAAERADKKASDAAAAEAAKPKPSPEDLVEGFNVEEFKTSWREVGLPEDVITKLADASEQGDRDAFNATLSEYEAQQAREAAKPTVRPATATGEPTIPAQGPATEGGKAADVEPVAKDVDNPLQAAQQQMDSDRSDTEALLREALPDTPIKITTNPHREGVAVSPDGKTIEASHDLARKLKERFPGREREALGKIVDEERIHQEQIGKLGEGFKDKLADVWKNASRKVRLAVNTIYGPSRQNATADEMGAELLRMAAQSRRGSGLTESMHPTRGKAATDNANVINQWADEQQGEIAEAIGNKETPDEAGTGISQQGPGSAADANPPAGRLQGDAVRDTAGAEATRQNPPAARGVSATPIEQEKVTQEKNSEVKSQVQQAPREESRQTDETPEPRQPDVLTEKTITIRDSRARPTFRARIGDKANAGHVSGTIERTAGDKVFLRTADGVETWVWGRNIKTAFSPDGQNRRIGSENEKITPSPQAQPAESSTAPGAAGPISIDDVHDLSAKKSDIAFDDAASRLKVVSEFSENEDPARQKDARDFIDRANALYGDVKAKLKGVTVNERDLKERVLSSPAAWGYNNNGDKIEMEDAYPLPVYVAAGGDPNTVGLDLHQDGHFEMFEGNDEATPATLDLVNNLLGVGDKKVRVWTSQPSEIVLRIKSGDIPEGIFVSPKKEHAAGYYGEGRELTSFMIPLRQVAQHSEVDWQTRAPLSPESATTTQTTGREPILPATSDATREIYPQESEDRIKAGLNPDAEAETIPDAPNVSEETLNAAKAAPINGTKAKAIQDRVYRGVLYGIASNSPSTADMFYGAGSVTYYLYKVGILKPGHKISEFEPLRATMMKQLAGPNSEKVAAAAKRLTKQIDGMLKASEDLVDKSKTADELVANFAANLAAMPDPSATTAGIRKQHEANTVVRFSNSVGNWYNEYLKKNNSPPGAKEIMDAWTIRARLYTLQFWSDLKLPSLLAPGQDMAAMKKRLRKREALLKEHPELEAMDESTPKDTTQQFLYDQLQKFDIGAPPQLVDSPETAAFNMAVQRIVGSKYAISTQPGDIGDLKTLFTLLQGNSDATDEDIDAVVRKNHEALQHTEPMQADSWQEIPKLADERPGGLIIADPSYFNEEDKQTSNYGIFTEIKKSDKLIALVDKYLLPAWEKGARIILTNTYEPETAQRLRERGFNVLVFSRTGGVPELVAYNASPTSGRLLPTRPKARWAETARKAEARRFEFKPGAEPDATGGTPSVQASERRMAEGAAGENGGRGGVAPIFYSQVERTVEQAKQPKAPGEQWWNWLKAQQGIKAEELEWLGVEEWLAPQASVTKDALLDFVRANKIEVHEVVKGGVRASDALKDMTDEQLREHLVENMGADSEEVVMLPRHQLELKADELADPENASGNEATKFEQYQLPGGSSYRELLLTLPVLGKLRYDELSMERTRRVLSVSENKEIRDFEDRVSNTPPFTSSHFSEPNVLAHVRWNERVDADGKRVLFIEEVQSDWMQKGRDQGFKRSVPESEIAKFTVKSAAEVPDYPAVMRTDWIVYDGDGRVIATPPLQFNKSATDALALIVKQARAGDIILKDGRWEGALGAVPDAPFKTTWPLLIFKRVLRHAAENGFDSVAWTTGEQQGDRYDLSKQVEMIYASKRDDRTFRIRAYQKGSDAPVISKSATPSELPNLIGKDLASKIVADLTAVNDEKEYRGPDLKVGAEGMRAFYDVILPAEVNKYVKKWGGRVGQQTLALGGPELDEKVPRDPRPNKRHIPFDRFVVKNKTHLYGVHGDGGPGDEMVRVVNMSSPAMAQRFADDYNKLTQAFLGGGMKAQVHTLDITDSMQDAALAGQPLFSRKRRGPTKRTLDRANIISGPVDDALSDYPIPVLPRGEKDRTGGTRDPVNSVMSSLRFYLREGTMEQRRIARELKDRWTTESNRSPDEWWAEMAGSHPAVAGTDLGDFMANVVRPDLDRIMEGRPLTASEEFRDKEAEGMAEDAMRQAVESMEPGSATQDTFRQAPALAAIGTSAEQPYRLQDGAVEAYKGNDGWHVRTNRLLPFRRVDGTKAGRAMAQVLDERLAQAKGVEDEQAARGVAEGRGDRRRVQRGQRSDNQGESEAASPDDAATPAPDRILQQPALPTDDVSGAGAEEVPEPEDAAPMAAVVDATRYAEENLEASRPYILQDLIQRGQSEQMAKAKADKIVVYRPEPGDAQWEASAAIADVFQDQLVPTEFMPYNGLRPARLGNVILVDKKNDFPVITTTGHELWHGFKQYDTGTKDPKTNPYLALKMVLDEQVTMAGVKAYLSGKAGKGKIGMSDLAVRDELYGDFMGEMLTEQRFWKRLYAISQKAFDLLARFVDRIIGRVNVPRHLSVMDYFNDAGKAMDAAAAFYKHVIESKGERAAATGDELPFSEKRARQKLTDIDVNDPRLYGEGQLTYTGKPSMTKGPIDVIYTEDGQLLVEDGWHRIQDAKMRGDKTIKARVFNQNSKPFVQASEKRSADDARYLELVKSGDMEGAAQIIVADLSKYGIEAKAHPGGTKAKSPYGVSWYISVPSLDKDGRGAEYQIRVSQHFAASRERTQFWNTNKDGFDRVAIIDAVYSELAKDPEGNKVELQRMVDEAAKKAGYNVGPVFHATNAEKINEFDPSRSGQASGNDLQLPGIYFSGSRVNASRFGKNIGRYFLRSNKPFEFGRLVRAVDKAGKDRWVPIAEGYDSVGVPPDGRIWGNTEIVVFDPSQIKSADPITRDESGEVIPLSARFNPESPDIRLSERREPDIKAIADAFLAQPPEGMEQHKFNWHVLRQDDIPEAVRNAVLPHYYEQKPKQVTSDNAAKKLLALGDIDAAEASIATDPDWLADERIAAAILLHAKYVDVAANESLPQAERDEAMRRLNNIGNWIDNHFKEYGQAINQAKLYYHNLSSLQGAMANLKWTIEKANEADIAEVAPLAEAVATVAEVERVNAEKQADALPEDPEIFKKFDEAVQRIKRLEISLSNARAQNAARWSPIVDPIIKDPAKRNSPALAEPNKKIDEKGDKAMARIMAALNKQTEVQASEKRELPEDDQIPEPMFTDLVDATTQQMRQGTVTDQLEFTKWITDTFSGAFTGKDIQAIWHVAKRNYGETVMPSLQGTPRIKAANAKIASKKADDAQLELTTQANPFAGWSPEDLKAMQKTTIQNIIDQTKLRPTGKSAAPTEDAQQELAARPDAPTGDVFSPEDRARFLTAKAQTVIDMSKLTPNAKAAFLSATTPDTTMAELYAQAGVPVEGVPFTSIIDAKLADLLTKPVLQKAIRDHLRTYGESLPRMAMQDASAAQGMADSLTKELVAFYGFTPYKADILKQAIRKRMVTMTAEAKQKELKRILSKDPNAKPRTRKQKQALDRVVSLNNLGAFDQQQIHDAILRELGILKPITPEQMAQLKKNADNVKNAPEGFQQRDAVIEARHYISKLAGPNWYRLGMGIIYNNLLANYRTDQRNFISNASNMFGSMMAGIAADPRTAPARIAGYIQGTVPGLLEASAALRGMSVVRMEGKLELPGGTRFKDLPGKAGKALGWIDYGNFASYKMVAGDMLWFKPAEYAHLEVMVLNEMLEGGMPYREAVRSAREKLYGTKAEREARREQAEREIMARPGKVTRMGRRIDIARRAEEIRLQSMDPNMLAEARMMAAIDSFNFKSVGMLGKAAEYFATFGENKKNTLAERFLVRNIVLFTNIIANVSNATWAGIPVIGKISLSGRHGLRTYKNDHERAVHHRLMQLNAAAVVGILIADLVASGLGEDDDDEKKRKQKDPWFAIYGAGPGDKATRDLMKDQGWKPYSIKIGNRYIKYQLLTPIAGTLTLLGTMRDAQRYDLIKGSEDMSKADATLAYTGYLATSLAQSMLNMSFLSTAADLLSAISEPTVQQAEKAMMRIVSSIPSRLIPLTAIQREVSHAIDQRQFDAKTVTQYLLRDIPFASKLLTPSVNILGDEIVQDRSVLVASAKPNAVYKVLSDNDAVPGYPGQATRIDVPKGYPGAELTKTKEGSRYTAKLTQDEYHAYVKISGQLIKKRVESSLSYLQRADPKTVQDQVKKFTDEARDQARTSLEAAARNPSYDPESILK